MTRVLIAGIGNIFLGDDGFGCAVAAQLAARAWPAGVYVRDFGIRGLDLAYALLDGYDAALLVDAVPRGATPGTVYVIEPDLRAVDAAQASLLDAHALDPLKVLALVQALGGEVKRLLLVGCEPLTLEEQMGLSAPVTAAVAEAVSVIESLITEFVAPPSGEIASVGEPFRLKAVRQTNFAGEQQ